MATIAIRWRLVAVVAVTGVAGWQSTAAEPKASEWVTLRGKIVLSNPPAPRRIDVSTDREFCTQNGPLLDESLVVSKAGGVKNVVVWLRPNTDRRTDPFPKDRIHPDLAAATTTRVIDTPCCQIEPRVTAAMAGDRLVIKNSAKVAHNTQLSADADVNPSLMFGANFPSGGKYEVPAPLAAQRTPIPIVCNIHPWMKGYIRVFDHPYFSVTDADGGFEIRNAPAGKWRLVIWHENGFHRGKDGILGTPVELAAPMTGVPAVELELPRP